MLFFVRILPAIIVALLILVLAHVILSRRNMAPQTHITVLNVLATGFFILTILLGIVSLYAFYEHNIPVLELFGSGCGIAFILALFFFIKKKRFISRHRIYGEKVARVTIINESLGSRFSRVFKKAFKEAFNEEFRRPRR